MNNLYNILASPTLLTAKRHQPRAMPQGETSLKIVSWNKQTDQLTDKKFKY